MANGHADTRKRIRMAILILSAVVIAWVCSAFFFQIMLIQGDSMLPAYHNMQVVILNKTERQFSSGDVIAFRCDALSSVLVKRIVACPGETAEIRDGVLYIDDIPSTAVPQPERIDEAGLLALPVSLSDGEYIVLGDNIPESKDSRHAEVGIVKEKDIIGIVCGSGDR